MRGLRRGFVDALWDRLDDVRDWRSRRIGAVTGEAVAGVILLASLLTLGVVAARAVTAEDEPVYVRASSTSQSSPLATASVTETIVRDGKTVRVVRQRTSPGDTVLKTISRRGTTLVADGVTVRPPAQTVHQTRTVTVHDTRTVTSREVVTVTDTQPVTVTETVVETVVVTTRPGPPG